MKTEITTRPKGSQIKTQIIINDAITYRTVLMIIISRLNNKFLATI